MREAGIEVDAVDYARKPLDAATIRAIVEAVGSTGAVLNRRHEIAKQRGWTTDDPTVDELVEAASREPNLLRRPVLLRGGKALVGFDKSNRDAWSKLRR